MPLPAGITVITLTATFATLRGTPRSGWLKLTPTSVVTDPAGQVILTEEDIGARVSAGAGHVAVTVPCTDNPGLLPQGWAYTVTEDVPGAGRSYQILLPSTLGPSVDLSQVAPISPVVPLAPDALPLTGGSLTGPLYLAGDPAAPLGAATKRYVDTHGGDLTFSQDFTSTAVVTVAHGLGKHPAVTVYDSAGDQVEGDVTYLSSSALAVAFSAPFSGTVTCN